MGRKKQSEEEKEMKVLNGEVKAKVLTVRMNFYDYNYLYDRALHDGITMSDLIRDSLEEHTGRKFE